MGELRQFLEQGDGLVIFQVQREDSLIGGVGLVDLRLTTDNPGAVEGQPDGGIFFQDSPRSLGEKKNVEGGLVQ